MSDIIKWLLKMDIESIYSKLTQKGKRLFWHGIIHRIDITHYEKGRGGKKEFKITFL
ncbi:hypothetical protein [Anaerovibrio sp.]|uniref:hypothetical protein n=1 Tax=Anaerovibrio sp. TaxID=1872532 RepID=UPI0025BF0189|nr:hypothetical protein [Anaerovibrio sp.]MBR2143339.1 hypothetical protein [Anaerovibrio sp.]